MLEVFLFENEQAKSVGDLDRAKQKRINNEEIITLAIKNNFNEIIKNA